jgi:HEAT repeat protein
MNLASLILSCILALPAAATLPVAAAKNPKPRDCDTANACLQQLRAASGDKSGLDPDDEALVARLLSFGPDIVPALVEVLADPNESAATLAGYALRETQHIDVRFLPQIKAGLDRGLGWLPPALCRMDDDEAAREAVARFLVSKDAPGNQEAYALELCGRRAIPYIVEAARCDVSCSGNVHANLAAVLSRLDEARAEAAPGLLKIASDGTVSDDVAAGALHMIGALSTDARHLGTDLLPLRAQRPALAADVDETLVAIGSPEASQIFIERLATNPDRLALRDLAELGPAGARAGSTVVRLLDSDDRPIRIAAARTLGFIAYAEAAEPLIGLLDDPTDVRLNWVAAEALGRLQSQTALPALRATAQAHWYPPVRNAAATAIEHIEQRKAYESEFHPNNFPLEFFDFEHIGRGQAICKKPLTKATPESKQQKLYAANASRKLKKLAFESVVIGYGPAAEPEPTGDGKIELAVLTPDNMVEHRKSIKQVPSVALRVDGGWLAGSNRGEWRLVRVGE